jgi:prephenate dehydrogenase
MSTAQPEGGTQAAKVTPQLERLRAELEGIDQQLIALLATRVRLARDVGRAKREAGLPVLDPAREAAVVRRAGALAREAGVDDEDVRYIFWHIIGLTRRAQLSE